ncbi:MAG: hypothetical protein Q9M28_00600 [Mariprofundaceae bacterium]|nr:hypothetical protein [Mariprofundaceae bacterium]
MKYIVFLIVFIGFSMPVHASGLETETEALIQRYEHVEHYHARLSLRFAAFALHEQREGDWIDARYFLDLARQHDRQEQGGTI